MMFVAQQLFVVEGYKLWLFSSVKARLALTFCPLQIGLGDEIVQLDHIYLNEL